MTAFEWAAIGLILFGMVIPFLMMVVLTGMEFSQRRKARSNPFRANDYASLMEQFTKLFAKGTETRFNGPTLVACIRDLKKYPEYYDASILLLEEISITGSGKFDEMAKNEITSVEVYLLGLKEL